VPGEAGYSCWIHARNKSEVSRRLALQLLHLLSQRSGGGSGGGGSHDEFSGPVVVSAVTVREALPFSCGLF
jgi:hypothetical protein